MIFVTAIVALASLCWLLFHLATLALPVAAGISVAMLAHQTGAGLLGSALVGFAGGVLTLTAGQLLFGAVRTPMLRGPVALLFAAPAALTGYSVVHRILASSASFGFWSVLLGIVGAIITGTVAIAKVSALASDGPGRASLTRPRPQRAGVSGVGQE